MLCDLRRYENVDEQDDREKYAIVEYKRSFRLFESNGKSEINVNFVSNKFDSCTQIRHAATARSPHGVL